MPKHYRMKGLPKVRVEVLEEVWSRTGCMMKHKAVLYRSEHDGELTVRELEEFRRMFEPLNA